MPQLPPSTWVWDSNRRAYYYVTKDPSGNYIYHFQNEHAPAASEPRSTHVTGDVDLRSPHGRNNQLYASAANPVPAGTIQGTPSQGHSERLDASYHMRIGSEAYVFFKVGKVFSMLHVQAASENELRLDNDNISVIKFGERAFSQIRRFVIVEVRRGFVYACPISTYSKRGTLKSGCIPSQHSIVYLAGTAPVQFRGENFLKQPICVTPTASDPHPRMDQASRLNYAKVYPIEMNVKVKDIGDVDPACLSLLIQCYREENGMGSSSAYTYSPPQASSQYQSQYHGNAGYQH